MRCIDDWIINGGGTGITGDSNLLLFELLYLLSKHRLSWGVFEDLDDCWQTEDIWCVLTTELLNGGVTDITDDENLLLFEWISLQLKHQLSRGVIRCLPWLLPVPLLWRLPIPFGQRMVVVVGELVEDQLPGHGNHQNKILPTFFDPVANYIHMLN